MNDYENNIIYRNGYNLITSDNKVEYRYIPLYNFLYKNNPIDFFQASYNILIELENMNSIFWLDKAGKIFHCSDNMVRIVNRNGLSQLLSSLLGRQIYVFKDDLELRNKTKRGVLPPNSVLLLSTLRIVNGDVFYIGQNSGFIKQFGSSNVFFRNTFFRSFYLNTNKRNGIKFSIIIAYLNYISNYNINKFNYIMSLLSNFVKHISMITDLYTRYPASNILIFIANKDSGIDILLNEILIPLVGFLNYIEINDDTIQNHNIKNQVQNKILYIFNNITTKTTTDKTKKETLEKIFCPTDYFLFPINVKIITTEESYLPFNIKFEYGVFKVSGSLENFLKSTKEFNINTIDELKHQILLDLENFANILRAYVLTNLEALKTPKDADITKEPNLDDCITEFARELIFNSNVLEDVTRIIMQDKRVTKQELKDIETLYSKHKKIERKYIKKLFNHKYNFNISSKLLYSQLEKLEPDLFKKVLAPGGAKCFYFPNSN